MRGSDFAICFVVALAAACSKKAASSMDEYSPLACPSPAAVVPGAVTYYVATNVPGADDDACDGLSPTDAGNGHCPFKDFLGTRSMLCAPVDESAVGLRTT